MGCSFVASIQNAVGNVVDVVAPIVAAIPGPWQVPAMVVMAVNTVQNGGDLGDVIKSVGTAYLAGQIGGAIGAAGDSAAAAATYGTELGSAQSTMLAAQEAGMGTLGDVAGNIAGNVAKATVQGGSPLAALISGGVGSGVTELSGQIPGFADMSPAMQKAATTAMSAELQGKDPTQALMSQALNAGINAATSSAPTSNIPTSSAAGSQPASEYVPSTDYTVGANYGLGSGVDPTSGLTPPDTSSGLNADGSTNYGLANSTDSSGLQMPNAPTQTSMGGGYGFITPVEGGYMTSLGFVPTDSSSILGDPASFINDPNVLGKTVIGQDTVRAPLTGITTATGGSSINLGGALPTTGAASGTATGGTTTGGLQAVIDPKAIAGGYKTAGKAGYDAADVGLKQLYSGLTDAPKAAAVAPVLSDVYQPNFAQNMYQPQMPYYAPNQFFAEGGEVGDSSTTEVSTAAKSNLAQGLKALGSLDSGLKQPAHNLRQVQQSGTPYTPKVLPQLASLLRARGMAFADGGQIEDQNHPNYDGSPVFRTGGLEGLGGKYVEGKGDGTSDDISAMLANGEYVFSADVVSALGNGSNKAGADKLSEMVEAIRARARSTAPDKLPPDAKSPLEYLKTPKGKNNG